jgi:hypothetical protein
LKASNEAKCCSNARRRALLLLFLICQAGGAGRFSLAFIKCPRLTPTSHWLQHQVHVQRPMDRQPVPDVQSMRKQPVRRQWRLHHPRLVVHVLMSRRLVRSVNSFLFRF